MFSSVGGFRFISGGGFRAGIYLIQGMTEIVQTQKTMINQTFTTGFDPTVANANITTGVFFTDLSSNAISITGNSTQDIPQNMVVDSSYNQIIVGSTKANTAGDEDLYITKVDSTQNIVWQRTVGTSTRDSLVDVVTTDNDANIIAVGNCNVQTNSFFGKFSSSNGALLNQYTMNLYTSVDSIASDNANNVYVNITQNSSPDGVLVLKMQSDFTKTWGQYVELANLDLKGSGIAVDSGGNVYSSVQRTVNEDYLVKFSSAGNVEWQTGFNFATTHGFNAMTVDNENNLYVAGDFGTTPQTIQILKFDPSGNVVWSRSITGYGGNSNVAVNNINYYNNNIIISGWSIYANTQYGMIAEVPADGTKLGTYADGYVWGFGAFSKANSNLTFTSSTGPAFVTTSLTDTAGVLTSSSANISIAQNIQF